ncbi:MAG: flavodoxin family protein [Lachnospiraceae bacterium]|nr:flavodoxin family protein [Lachnospiraceae bacterium]
MRKKGDNKVGKILFINGSPNENGCTGTAMDEVIKVLQENDIETEKIWLGKKAMPDCMACMKCQEIGKCVFQDEVNEIAEMIDDIDGIVVGSPVYYGGPNGRLTSFLDRLFFSIPNDKFNGMLGASIVSCRRGGASAAFERLNQYFLMENMHVVSSQYWNQVHGFTVEDVRKDEEGLQTMRTLGRNIVWLLRSIKCGADNGISKPEHEPKTFTNFI